MMTAATGLVRYSHAFSEARFLFREPNRLAGIAIYAVTAIEPAEFQRINGTISELRHCLPSVCLKLDITLNGS